MIRLIAPWWAMIGFAVMMVEAIVRLSQYALEGMAQATPAAWVVAFFSVVFMLYTEGYRGFQKKFSPRFAKRAMMIRSEPTFFRVALAPLFCMSLFGATRGRMIASWLLVVMIVFFIIMIRQLDQPWRGAVDVGVVAGLSHGLLATLYFFVRAIRT